MRKKKERNSYHLQSFVKRSKLDYEHVFECKSCKKIIYDGTSCISEHL